MGKSSVLLTNVQTVFFRLSQLTRAPTNATAKPEEQWERGQKCHSAVRLV